MLNLNEIFRYHNRYHKVLQCVSLFVEKDTFTFFRSNAITVILGLSFSHC